MCRFWLLGRRRSGSTSGPRTLGLGVPRPSAGGRTEVPGRHGFCIAPLQRVPLSSATCTVPRCQDQSFKYDTDFAPGLRVAGTLATGQWQYASAPTARRPFVLDLRAGWFDREFMRGTLAEPLEQQFGAFTFDRMHFVGEEIASAQDTAAASAPVPGFTPPGYSSNTPWGVPAFFLGGGSRGEIA